MSLGESFPSILDAARARADWAVAALYKDLQPPMLGYLRSKCPAEAEDLAQETWIDVARGLSRFRGGEQDFRRFVFTIARRRLIDHLRRAASRPVRPAPVERPARRAPGGVDDEVDRRDASRELRELLLGRRRGEIHRGDLDASAPHSG